MWSCNPFGIRGGGGGFEAENVALWRMSCIHAECQDDYLRVTAEPCMQESGEEEKKTKKIRDEIAIRGGPSDHHSSSIGAITEKEIDPKSSHVMPGC